jgi:hypothetical protein
MPLSAWDVGPVLVDDFLRLDRDVAIVLQYKVNRHWYPLGKIGCGNELQSGKSVGRVEDQRRPHAPSEALPTAIMMYKEKEAAGDGSRHYYSSTSTVLPGGLNRITRLVYDTT